MDDRWWCAWIGPSVLALGVAVFLSVITGSWEAVLVMAGGLAAGIWYKWGGRRKGTTDGE